MKQKCFPVVIAALIVLLIGLIAGYCARGATDIDDLQPVINSRMEVEQADDSTVTLNDTGNFINVQTNQMLINGPVEPLAARSPLLAAAVNVTNHKGEHISIGTKISDDTILTHNHQMFELGIYMAIVSSGEKYFWAGEKSNSVGREVMIQGKKLGQQTRLVTYAQPLESVTASLATQNTINALKVGDRVDIVYWDDSRYQLTVGQFTIIDVSNVRTGEITVEDPMGIINTGDSGGGVYFKNQLIGNMWSIGGGAHIALIPPRITKDSKGTTIIN